MPVLAQQELTVKGSKGSKRNASLAAPDEGKLRSQLLRHGCDTLTGQHIKAKHRLCVSKADNEAEYHWECIMTVGGTCRESTIGCSSDFFMCDQAWNCWLMQVRKVAVDRKTSAGAGSHGDASRHNALKGRAGLNTCMKATHARVHSSIHHNFLFPICSSPYPPQGV